MDAKTVFFPATWLIILYIVLRTLIQIVFKHIALGPSGTNYFVLIFDPLFYLAGFIFFVQAVIWLMVLKRLPLSVAYPFTSLTVITLLISGALFFGETITIGNVLGTMLIMSGVAVIVGGQNHDKVNNVGLL